MKKHVFALFLDFLFMKMTSFSRDVALQRLCGGAERLTARGQSGRADRLRSPDCGHWQRGWAREGYARVSFLGAVQRLRLVRCDDRAQKDTAR